MTEQRQREPPDEREGFTARDGKTAPATCPECDGRIVDAEAERVCQECGLVVAADEIDSGPEWRAFDAAAREEKSRVGAPSTPLLHDKGLSTRIGWQDRDANGRSLEPRQREKMARLRTWDERFRTQDAGDRNLKHALGEIERMAAALGLPTSSRETAGVIYRRALDEELLPGRSIEGMATAALYAAARLDGVARSVDELAAVSRVEGLRIERAYRYLTRELELAVPPTDPTEYVGRFASELDCSEATERQTRELLAAATDEGVHSGKNPVGIAASALYAAGKLTDEDLTQADVSRVAEVSEVTIRNRYREVLSAAEWAASADG